MSADLPEPGCPTTRVIVPGRKDPVTSCKISFRMVFALEKSDPNVFNTSFVSVGSSFRALLPGWSFVVNVANSAESDTCLKRTLICGNLSPSAVSILEAMS